MRGEVRNALWNCGKGIGAGSAWLNSIPVPSGVGKDFFKCIIHGGDEAGVGAEVCSQENGIERKCFVVAEFKAPFLDAPEEFGFGIAERVD